MGRESEQAARDKYYGPLSKKNRQAIKAWAANLESRFPDTEDGDYWYGLHIKIVPKEDSVYSQALADRVQTALGSSNIYHADGITLYSRRAIVEILTAIIQQVAAETDYTAADVLELVQIKPYQHPPHSRRDVVQIYGTDRKPKAKDLTRGKSIGTLPVAEQVGIAAPSRQVEPRQSAEPQVKAPAPTPEMSPEALLHVIDQLEAMFFDGKKAGQRIEETMRSVEVEGSTWQVIGTGYGGKIVFLSPKSGLVIKFYFCAQHAQIVHDNLAAIEPSVEASGYRLLMPILLHGRALAFPHLGHNKDYELSHYASPVSRDLANIINRLGSGLEPATAPDVFVIDGVLTIVDPFEDSWPGDC